MKRCRSVVGVLLLGMIVASAAGTGCRHVDYFYGHRVTGKVVDAAGRPVAGAVVMRVDSPTGNAAGFDSLFLRRSGADGTFRFEHRGLGPKPKAEQTWHLKASRPGYPTARVTLRVPWVRDPKGHPLGYLRSGVLLRLGGAKAKK